MGAAKPTASAAGVAAGGFLPRPNVSGLFVCRCGLRWLTTWAEDAFSVSCPVCGNEIAVPEARPARPQ